MLARIDLRGSALPGARELAGLLPRAGTDIDSVMATVRPLCEDVRIRGAQAVREITARLDGVDADDFAVPQAALDRALAECDPTLRAALEEAITRVR
ncbi:MAG: hisD, partial [Marmoricola sp.]|nr:hisD [Marmoricola sp.]